MAKSLAFGKGTLASISSSVLQKDNSEEAPTQRLREYDGFKRKTGVSKSIHKEKNQKSHLHK